MKRVLMVSVASVEGGEKSRVFGLFNSLKDAGLDIDLLYFDGKKSINCGNIYKRPRIIRHVSISHFADFIPLIKKRKYDVIHGNTHSGAFYSIVAKILREKLIFDIHGAAPEEFELKKSSKFFITLLRTIEKIDILSSDVLLVVSRKMEQLFRKRTSKKVVYLTNGVDIHTFNDKIHDEELKKRLGLEGYRVFGYVGGFQAWQGVESLIKSAKLLEEERDLKFLFLGVSKDRISFYRKNYSNCIFLPKAERSTIPRYLSVCDTLVLPRFSHAATEVAAPTKFSEYCAMGKPVLATDVGDPGNLVRENNCGLVVKSNVPAVLAAGIVEMKSKSDAALERFGKNSRRLAEREFNWKNIAKKYLEIVDDL